VAKTNEVHDICAVILAAGEGTRMRSRLAKVLHPLLGRPLVHYPVDLCLRLGGGGSWSWCARRPRRLDCGSQAMSSLL